jgi:guanylate kinase
LGGSSFYSKKTGNSYVNSPERLRQLKGAELTVAVVAGVSLVVGYFAIKKTFSSSSKEMNNGAKAVPETPKPLVVAGPSGSGKSTLLKAAFKEFPEAFGFSVSHTTRQPRKGEVNGREYHFTSRDIMLKGIEGGEFIEHAEFSGNMYGTSKKAVRDVRNQGKICVLDIEMQGVRSIKKTDLGPVYVLIKPPSMEVLEERLKGRGTETEESMKKRLETAKVELEYAMTPGEFDHVITNVDKEQAIKEFFKILTDVYGNQLKSSK